MDCCLQFMYLIFMIATGSQTITVTGTDLGGVTRVQMGEYEVEVDFNNDTHLVITIPPVPEPKDSNVYQLLIFVPNKGYALMEE